MGSIRFIALLILILLNPIPANSQDLQRGLRNYQEIISGTKKFEQLSPQERQEVFTVMNKLKYQSKKSPDCKDAVARAESTASALADYSRRLRSCAESQNLEDDCSGEYRRVKNSFGDYESAVSSVKSYCN